VASSKKKKQRCVKYVHNVAHSVKLCSYRSPWIPSAPFIFLDPMESARARQSPHGLRTGALPEGGPAEAEPRRLDGLRQGAAPGRPMACGLGAGRWHWQLRLQHLKNGTLKKPRKRRVWIMEPVKTSDPNSIYFAMNFNNSRIKSPMFVNNL
jgi:hypothetical protein